MDSSKSADKSIRDCLRNLGISSLSDWDVLIFVYRHRANLCSADQIARLLGYTSKAVGSSLDRLESKGLVQRSRYSQGVRFYQFGSLGKLAPPGSCLEQLMGLAENREGRLMLLKLLNPDKSGA